MKTIAAYGTWNSDLSGDYIAQASVKLSEPVFYDDSICWLEGRPAEKGRQTVVRRKCDGRKEDLVPAPWNVRSKAHEYGGGCYCFGDGRLFFCNSDDQQIYQLDLHSGVIKPLTSAKQCRFADLVFDAHQQRLLAVCEDHSNATQEPHNCLVALSIDEITAGEQKVIDQNHDFFCSPRLSPCGRWLTYVTWDHPNMPWDSSQLWLCSIDAQGKISAPKPIAGEEGESLAQPQWSPAGELFWASDRSDWWNLYSLTPTDLERVWRDGAGAASPQAVYACEAEFATPQWVFNMSCYGFLTRDEILAAYSENGRWQLIHLQRAANQWQAKPIASDLVAIANVSAGPNGRSLLVGAGPYSAPAIYQFADNTLTCMHAPTRVELNSEDISVAQTLAFATAQGENAHAFFYAPTNAKFDAPAQTLPPVIVLGHGGPTGATAPSFSYKIQYWTQRGFAVLDVNYRGSTGFGRRYRNALQGQWGVVDVQDLSAAAEYVSAKGWVHPEQRIIRGSSAGGYSVLAALTDTNTFNAGVTLYGIGDLETLATDTHKFESRYLDGLIGPYPEQKSLYRQRSPIHKVEQIRCPVLVFQGGEDKVVPVNQAEQMVAAIKAQGVPVAYVFYPNEGHGFRQSDTIAHQLQTELSFYQQVFALQASPNSGTTPVAIANWAQH